MSSNSFTTKQLGWKAGHYFVAVRAPDEDGREGEPVFSIGSVVCLEKDDFTSCPGFRLICNGKYVDVLSSYVEEDDIRYEYTSAFEPLEEIIFDSLSVAKNEGSADVADETLSSYAFNIFMAQGFLNKDSAVKAREMAKILCGL